jgi:hypothetical protein
MWLPLKNLIFILIPTHVALIFPYLSQLDKKQVMLSQKFVCGFRNNMTRFPNHKICFQNSQCVVSRKYVELCVESKLHGYVDLRFACFYLTGQLESILQKFQLAGVVLVGSKPHVLNLTGQLVSKPPKFPT